MWVDKDGRYCCRQSGQILGGVCPTSWDLCQSMNSFCQSYWFFFFFSLFIHLRVFCVKSRQTSPNCMVPIFFFLFVAMSNKSNIRIWFNKTSAVLSVWQSLIIIIYFSMTNRIPIINNNGSRGKNAYVCNKNIFLLFGQTTLNWEFVWTNIKLQNTYLTPVMVKSVLLEWLAFPIMLM